MKAHNSLHDSVVETNHTVFGGVYESCGSIVSQESFHLDGDHVDSPGLH